MIDTRKSRLSESQIVKPWIDEYNALRPHTESALRATSGPYLKSQLDKFAALFVEPPVEELYEVAAEG